MYTKEKLYQSKRGRKSIRGWIYSFAAALLLIAVAAVLLAAKWPEKISGQYLSRAGAVNTDRIFFGKIMEGRAPGEDARRLSAGTARVSGKALKRLQISEKERQLWKERSKVPLVAIDAGHGGIDSGCLGGNGKIMEKDINLEIALLLREELEANGFRVMMLRETDEFLDKEERVELANSYQADIYVSIHQNTYEGRDKSIGGIETWYDGGDETRDNKALAGCVHREAVKSTGAVERSLIDSDELYVLSKTLMPACLIETGFLSNPEECRRLSDGDYQKKLAEGIATGIMTYIHQNV